MGIMLEATIEVDKLLMDQRVSLDFHLKGGLLDCIW